MKKLYKFGFIGTGAWGSALANVLSENGHNVIMYGIDKVEVDDINNGYNQKYFWSLPFYAPDKIKATLDFDEVVLNSENIVLAVPANTLKGILKQMHHSLKNRKVNIINLSKGIESVSEMFFSDFIQHRFKRNLKNLVSLVGPSFAIEVFQKEVTIINILGTNSDYCQEIMSYFNNRYFQLRHQKNVLGSELFSALKNVLAIGLGILSNHTNSNNTVAAIITIGVNEILDIYKVISGNDDVKMGFDFAGIGDVFLTCNSSKSRNYMFGNQISEFGISKALENNSKTIEGYQTAKILAKMLKEKQIETKLFQSIIDILFNKKEPILLTDFLVN
ncbi:NAD(P)H-dependent glycerol-3-phosphate dehydrogenase [Mycoplasma sp. 394]